MRAGCLLKLGMLIVTLGMVAPALGQGGEWPAPKKDPKPAQPAPGKPEKSPKPADGAPAGTADRIKREAKGVFGTPQNESGAGDGEHGNAASAGGWSVVIASVRGENQERDAATLLGRVRTEGGLIEAVSQKRGEATVIVLGDYAGPDDARAQVDLKRVRETVVEGARPYVLAFLAPPMTGFKAGAMPQYNLVQAKQQFGDSALYTLQVGVYGRLDLERPSENDLKEARSAAEQAAFKLRQEGELAFYYHSPTLSMVTVGVFDISDFDPQVPTLKSARLRESQKRFPYNLYNGQAIRVKSKVAGAQGAGAGTLQPSNLVALPTK